MLGKRSAGRAIVAAGLAMLAVGAAADAPAQTAPTGPVLRVSYIEFSLYARSRAVPLLRRYALLERQAMHSASTAHFQIIVLQELGRPERWVLLQSAASAAALSTADAASKQVWHQIEALLVAPPDLRGNHPMAGTVAPLGTGVAEPARAGVSASTVYEVTHLDIGSPPAGQSAAAQALGGFLDAARASRGNRLAGVWQQAGHSNHYAIVLEWADRADRDAFADGPAARLFRRQLAALIGSPMDEQLFRRRD